MQRTVAAVGRPRLRRLERVPTCDAIRHDVAAAAAAGARAERVEVERRRWPRRCKAGLPRMLPILLSSIYSFISNRLHGFQLAPSHQRKKRSCYMRAYTT